MTMKDLQHWFDGKPLYTVALEDEDTGHPIGIAYADGTTTLFDSSNMSRVGQESVVTGNTLTTVWDGAMADPDKGGKSKGRLLPVNGPAYIDSLVRLKHLARGGKEDEDEAKGGAGKGGPRKEKADRPKGKQKVAAVGQGA